MIEVCVLTYARPGLLSDLLDHLDREVKGRADIHVTVYDDHSPQEDAYSVLSRRLEARGWAYWKADQRHGHAGHVRWLNRLYSVQRFTEADTWIWMPDDFRLAEGFLDKLTSAWESIVDPNKGCLTYHRDASRASRPCWTPQRPAPISDRVEKIGWVDGAFICGRQFFDALDWSCPRPSPRAYRDPLIGSGAGAGISARLDERGMGMYRTLKSLAVHRISPTVMHPDLHGRIVRQQTIDFVGGEAAAKRLSRLAPVHGGMATLYARRGHVASVVESLLPQVDRLTCYLDDYPPGESFPMVDDRLTIVRPAGRRLGDAGKFCGLEGAQAVGAYYASFDDDLIYPAGYIDTLLHHVEARGRRAVVSLHGRNVTNALPGGYYAARPVFRCLGWVPKDTPVHVLGTGVCMFHTSTLPELLLADFKTANMADIWLAVACHRSRVPRVVARHPKGWLTYISVGEETIHARSRGGAGEAEMTREIRNAAPWGAPLPDPVGLDSDRRKTA